eukprot:evm.model.NODE_42083_length_13037_cov_30.485924.3
MSSSGGSFLPSPSSSAGATAAAGGAVSAKAGIGVGAAAEALEGEREEERGRGGGGIAAPFSSSFSSPPRGRRRDRCQEAEMYLVDPTGLVLCVRGQAFGGGLVDDPVAHELQEWLAREGIFGRVDGKEEGEEEEDEGEEEGVVWAKLWEGMQKYFPTLVAHPEKVECARAAGSSFRRVGTLDQVLLRCGK